ncbi:MAG: hypothetical protein ABII88_06985 [Candidatus Omnitrophota bacterium]
MFKKYLLFIILFCLFSGGCSQEGKKTLLELNSGNAFEEDFNARSGVFITVGPVKTKDEPVILNIQIKRAKTAGEVPLISNEKWDAPSEGISFLDTDALIKEDQMLEGWSIVSVSKENKAAMIVWRPRKKEIQSSVGGIYDACWQSPLETLKKGENIFYLDNHVQLLAGDVLGLFVYKDIPTAMKDENSLKAYKYYKGGKAESINTNIDVKDTVGAYAFMPFSYTSFINKNFNIVEGAEQIVEVELPNSIKSNYYRIRLSASEGNLQILNNANNKPYCLKNVASLENYPRRFYFIGSLLVLLTALLVSLKGRVFNFIGFLNILFGIKLLLFNDAGPIFSYFIAYILFWIIPVLVVWEWLSKKLSGLPNLFNFLASHIIWFATFLFVGKLLCRFNLNLNILISGLLIFNFFVYLAKKEKVHDAFKSIILHFESASFLFKFLLTTGGGILFLVWAQQGLWQRTDFDVFCYVAIVNKLLASGALAAGNYDPFLGPPIRFMAPYIQNPEVLYHAFLSVVSNQDVNIVFAVGALIVTVFWCFIAGGFAWYFYPGNKRIIGLTFFFAVVLQISNRLFSVPLFVHNANPGATGHVVLLSMVLFHNMFNSTNNRWMLGIAVTALTAALLCHVEFVIFTLFYCLITAGDWIIRCLYKKKWSFEEPVFLIASALLITTAYLLMPRGIMNDNAFQMGTFYPSNYIEWFGQKIVDPKIVFTNDGVYWVRNIGYIIAFIFLAIKSQRERRFTRILSVAAIMLPIFYFIPGIPGLLVSRISEIGFMRLMDGWSDFFIILGLIVFAFYVDKLLMKYLVLRHRELFLVILVVFVMGVVSCSKLFLPPNRYDYVHVFRVKSLPLLRHLKQYYTNDLLITETSRAYWMGAQLPGYVYAYMVGRLRTYYDGAGARVEANERIWQHDGSPQEIAQMVRNLSPANVLIGKKEKYYTDFLHNEFFIVLYEDDQWALFGLKHKGFYQ